MECRIVIDEVPPSLNITQRIHWGKLKKLKDYWYLLITIHKPKDWEQPTFKDFYNVKITRYAPRLLDMDNLAGSYKVVIDCLKSHIPPYGLVRGLIWDDDPKHSYFIFEQKKSKERRTVIEIKRR